jgi:membrane associated rhomboid family serine protease
MKNTSISKDLLQLLSNKYIWIPLAVSLGLALIFVLDQSLNLHLFEFGLRPRDKKGLLGIISAPLIHGDWDHLRNNLISFTVLSSGLLYFYPRKALPVIVITWLLSGIGVWFWGRDSFHIGASGLIYALAAFIFISGVLRAHPNLLALSMLVAFLYGSMIWGLVPTDPQISYEGHVSGALSGLLLAVYFRNSPPRNIPKAFSYDDIEDDLSEQIERFGTDYWRQNTDDQNGGLKVNYHYRAEQENEEKT